jgi:diadenosine tetraphosphatase ApaH/serine/threonine PP2A family protein phosphatase
MPRDRFALISDIHANLEALTAVFEDIDALGVTDVRCLGDVLGYGADPEACTAMVAARCRWTILGNHDHGLGTPLRDFNPLAADALERTRKRLRPAWFRPGRKRNWEFLTSLPNRKEEGGFLFVHGSPRDPILEYLLKSDGFLDPDKLAANFAQIDRPCFVGHTHWPGWHDTTFRFTHARGDHMELELPDGPILVNVGSVGQPRDGDPRASYVVVDGRTVHFRRVAYDVAAAQSKILAAGFHPALAERLARGK